jgi:hypothetical protein
VADRPPKCRDIVKEIRRHLAQRKPQFSIGLHAQDEAANDGISRREIMQVLKKTGVHVPEHDQYSEHFETWKYRLEGPTLESRKIAVAVSFTPRPPLPLPELCVITVFALGKTKK